MTILPQLERDLFDAATRTTAPPAQSRRTHRRLAATAAMALSAVVVIAVTAIALSLRHGHSASTPTSAVPSVSSTRRELIATLGVLRTLRSKATVSAEDEFSAGGLPERLVALDHRRHRSVPASLRKSLARFGNPRIDQSLVRVVHARYDQTVILIPTAYQPSQRSPRRIEGLALTHLVPGSDPSGLTTQPLAALRAHGLNSFTYAHHVNVGAVVVPNGVTKVSLGPLSVALGTLRASSAAPIPTSTAIVHQNVAAFRLAVPTVPRWPNGPLDQDGMSSSGAHARMTWYSTNGNAIKRTTILIAFHFIVR